MQVIAGLAIGGVVTAGAAIVIAPAYNNVKLEGAYQEIALILDSVSAVRRNTGGYADVGATGSNRTPTASAAAGESIAFLKANGYLVSEQYTIGAVGENFLGGGVVIVLSAPAVNIIYGTDSPANCQALLNRIKNTIPRVSNGALTACADSAQGRRREVLAANVTGDSMLRINFN